MGLNPKLLASIKEAGFKKASPIQELTLAPILSGKDIFAQAETGSGKTAAFVIPILEQILRDDKSGSIEAHETRYAVLCPTRELAQQTFKVFQEFGKSLGVESCCVIGGESMSRQKELINQGVHVLIATPGRFADLLKQKVVGLAHCKGVVFDEADRLFDMGFKKDIEFILSKTSDHRQLIMLSATSNQDVLRTAYKFKSVPEELRLNEDSLLVDHIDHKLAMISGEEKFPFLVKLLRDKENAYAIVFCNTQIQTHCVAEWLILMGFKAKPISGRLPQNKRTKLMADFREKKVTILVCTDVAARGLDIKNVNLVVNYNLPQEAANYVHRIGRTGRAGEEGNAVSFCAHEDCEYLDPIYDMIESKIEKLDVEDSDFATDICKKPYLDRNTMRVSTSRGDRERRPRKEYGDKDRGSSRERRPERQSRGRSDLRSDNRSDNRTRAGVAAKTNERGGQNHSDRAPKREEKVSQNVEVSRKSEDKRFLELTAYGVSDVSSKALRFFKIDDETLLGHEVLEAGPKKYILFGPRKTKYKFFVKPIYKKLLLPFLIEVIKDGGFDLHVKVSYRPTSLLVSFSGKDDKLLADNRYELLNAFEHIIKTYLQSRVVLHRNLKIQVKCFKPGEKNKPNDKRGREATGRRDNDKWLIKLAETTKKKVLDLGEPVKLKPLNASERRIIHQHFQDDSEIKTSSIGDGRYKQVMLSPR
ncbi:MAG: DEAD/DEAH box helicase [Bacteriovoracaceae bacterium]|jgi:ATP-dependent RNA helicase RhlE|nr:DEAD/DEAH box helicase [Bacteriovoracaceae bacterium]